MPGSFIPQTPQAAPASGSTEAVAADALRARLSRFPAGLRELVEAELASGNTVADLGGPPAPPAGDSIRLGRAVTTRPRAPGADYDFFERNSSLWSGEFHDARRFYFVLEPPRGDGEVPAREAERPRPEPAAGVPVEPPPRERRPPVDPGVEPASALARFRASLVIDRDAWRDGRSYDLDALATASPVERATLEKLLLSRPVADWRDVEALAALGTPEAEESLRRTLRSGDAELKLAVLRHAPHLAPGRRLGAILAACLRDVRPFGGLSAALDLAAEHDSPAVRAALWTGLLDAPGDVACHFADLLLRLHGRTDEPFDTVHRDLLHRFNTPEREARVAAYRELALLCGVDPETRRDRSRRGRARRQRG